MGMPVKRQYVVAVFAAMMSVVFVLKFWRPVDHDRFDLLRVQLRFSAAAIAQYRLDNHAYPPSLEALCGAGPAGLGPYLRTRALIDPWGRALFYRVDGDGRGFVVFSLGGDGRVGGRGGDADIGESARIDAP